MADLVERFERDRKVFLSPDYQIGARDRGLGTWDSDPSPEPPAPNPSCFQPVIHEESINACPERSRRVAGATKAPDYTFRIGGRRVFFAEAKKPAVNIAGDARTLDPAARRGILTKQTRGET
ncbi:MAG TPA: hypothetical protein VMH22_01935 [bacterium]|nr:hypothetical protein [bacterium]